MLLRNSALLYAFEMLMYKSRLSIIIPTLNEESYIKPLLDYLSCYFPQSELIVVDGQSSDQTLTLASSRANCLSCNPGRGRQLNFGAAQSSGEILWFIHADCLPHMESETAIRLALQDQQVVGGGFEYFYRDDQWPLSIVARASNLKNRIRKQVYGDMGIFVRREVFERMSGFTQPDLMEDFDFGRRLRKEGKIAILKEKMATSIRDWQREGFIRKLLKDSSIKFAHLLGVDNRRLYQWYYREAK